MIVGTYLRFYLAMFLSNCHIKSKLLGKLVFVASEHTKGR